MPEPHGTSPEDYRDFSHREMRPDHEPNPTPKGIGLGESTLMDPRKFGKLLNKVSGKSKGGKTKITHGKR